MVLLPPFNTTSVDAYPILHLLFPISLPAWYLLGLLYTALVLLGAVGNVLVLHAARRKVLDFGKVGGTFFVHLAIADLMIILVQGLPTVAVFFADRWPLGHQLCNVLVSILLLNSHILEYYIIIFIQTMRFQRFLCIVSFKF